MDSIILNVPAGGSATRTLEIEITGNINLDDYTLEAVIVEGEGAGNAANIEMTVVADNDLVLAVADVVISQGGGMAPLPPTARIVESRITNTTSQPVTCILVQETDRNSRVMNQGLSPEWSVVGGGSYLPVPENPQKQRFLRTVTIAPNSIEVIQTQVLSNFATEVQSYPFTTRLVREGTLDFTNVTTTGGYVSNEDLSQVTVEQSAPTAGTVDIIIADTTLPVPVGGKGVTNIELRNTDTSTAKTVQVMVRPVGSQADIDRLYSTGSVRLPLYKMQWEQHPSIVQAFIPLRVTIPAATNATTPAIVTKSLEIELLSTVAANDDYRFEAIITEGEGAGKQDTVVVDARLNTDITFTVVGWENLSTNPAGVPQPRLRTFTTAVRNNTASPVTCMLWQKYSTSAGNERLRCPVVAVSDTDAFVDFSAQIGDAKSLSLRRKTLFLAAGATVNVLGTVEAPADADDTGLYSLQTAIIVGGERAATTRFKDVLSYGSETLAPDGILGGRLCGAYSLNSLAVQRVSIPSAITIIANPDEIELARGEKRTSVVTVSNSGAVAQTVRVQIRGAGDNKDSLYQRLPDGSFALDSQGNRIPLIRLRWL